MNNKTLARICVNKGMTEQEKKELNEFFTNIREKANNDSEYKDALTDYNLPMEMEYTRKNKQKQQENHAREEAYKDRMRLYAIARSSNNDARQAVAEFEYTPDEALLYLANSFDRSDNQEEKPKAEGIAKKLCIAIAQNPNSAPYTLDVLTTNVIKNEEESMDAKKIGWEKENIELLKKAKQGYENETLPERKLTSEEREQIIEETEHDIANKEKTIKKYRDEIEKRIGGIIRELIENPNTPQKARNLIGITACKGLLRKVNVDVDTTYSQESQLNAAQDLLEKNKKSIDQRMLPYLKRYCSNCILTNGQNGLKTVKEIFEAINGKTKEDKKNTPSQKIATMCRKTGQTEEVEM